MWLSAASLALLLVAAPAARDTTFTVTIHGVVLIYNDASGEPDHASLLLSDPVTVEQDHIWMLPVTGEVKEMDRWSGRYVEATGSITGVSPDGLSFTPTKVKERQPEGAVRRDADPSLSQHAVVILAVIPNHFSVPPYGRGSRISPVVLYTIANYSQTDLQFRFSTHEFVCFELSRKGEKAPRWSSRWQPTQPSDLLTIRMGPAFRALMPIPAEKLAWPGQYTVRASLCGFPEYAAAAPLVLSAE